MSNMKITFTAVRNLVAGVIAGDEISLDVSATAFDRSLDINKRTSRPMDGSKEESSLFYIGKQYSISFIDEGIVTLDDLSTTTMTTDYVEMFFYSVAASEEFTLTSLDDADASKDVQMIGTPSYQRRSPADVNKFSYTINVREIL